MAQAAEHFRTVAGDFTARVDEVTGDDWERPAPCEGWVARDVVRHLTEWVPGFLDAGAGVAVDPGPSVDEDPAGAWTSLRDQLQAILDDPGVSERAYRSEMLGEMPLDVAIQRFVTGDVLVHTWDLARACGLDEALDAESVHHMYEGMKPMAAMLPTTGHFSAAVEVPDDADEQTKLIALTGRTP